MFPLKEKAPGYLLGPRQMIATLVLTALFTAFVMLLYMPFSHNPWLEMELSRSVGFVVLFYVVCLGLLILSRVFLYLSRKSLTMLGYTLWMAAEVLFISLFYAFATLQAEELGVITVDQSFPVLVFKSVAYCMFAMIVPCVFAGMYFNIEEKDNMMRMSNFSSVVSDERAVPIQKNKITLFDNNGVMKLSVNESNLLYIESDDNYVKVWYTDSEENLKQYMLRCRLKTIEESFMDSSLVRCHRKYIVNMMRVRTISKEKEGYVIVLDTAALPPIPVTKTYEENVLLRFNSR